jgi:glycosyltransferase involved in cell wall biosynthesis
MIKNQILKEEEKMGVYQNKTVWIICLLNECEAKGDLQGKKIKNLISQIINKTEEKKIPVELVLVNNGSTDNTMEVLEQIVFTYPGKIVVLNEPIQGKARAERRGFSFAIKDENVKAIVTLDADGEHDILDILNLYAEFEKENPLFAVGSRFGKSGKRNKKDEILRNLLVNLSGLSDLQIPDDPRCGGRVYQPEFIRRTVLKTIAQNYALQYELVALALLEIKTNQNLKICSLNLKHYEPHRSKVFKKELQPRAVNPELIDLCKVMSSVFGTKSGDKEEGRKIINKFGLKIGKQNLFAELSDLFFKGKMVTDHGAKAASEFMETPPIS